MQSVRGEEGIFLGSVTYAVEVRDAQDGRLLKAYASKQYPNAMNVGASVGKLSAAKTGTNKGAQDLLNQLLY